MYLNFYLFTVDLNETRCRMVSTPASYLGSTSSIFALQASYSDWNYSWFS